MAGVTSAFMSFSIVFVVVFSFFPFSFVFFQKYHCQLLLSEFNCNCFLRSRCSIEMWCPDDIGPPTWLGESIIQLPRAGWKLLAAQAHRRGNGASLDSITCSSTTGRETKNLTTSATCSCTSGTGASRTGTPLTGSTSCSTVRRCTRSCGLTSTRRSGRDPATGTSSTSMAKNWVPAAWGGGFARNVAVKCISLSSSPALAVFCPRRAEW